jgi:AcrR family transcriptional regulator
VRQDARENRERILAAAETVFGQQGAAGSTEEVARLAGVGIATVFRHFPTKEALVEAALLRHFEQLTDQARTLAESTDPGTALRTLVRTLIETGSTKLTLASLLTRDGGFSPSGEAAAAELQRAVNAVLRRAQAGGAVRRTVRIEELYLLIRGLAQAQATKAVSPTTLNRAVDIVIAGMSAPAAG